MSEFEPIVWKYKTWTIFKEGDLFAVTKTFGPLLSYKRLEFVSVQPEDTDKEEHLFPSFESIANGIAVYENREGINSLYENCSRNDSVST